MGVVFFPSVFKTISINCGACQDFVLSPILFLLVDPILVDSKIKSKGLYIYYMFANLLILSHADK